MNHQPMDTQRMLSVARRVVSGDTASSFSSRSMDSSTTMLWDAAEIIKETVKIPPNNWNLFIPLILLTLVTQSLRDTLVFYIQARIASSSAGDATGILVYFLETLKSFRYTIELYLLVATIYASARACSGEASVLTLNKELYSRACHLYPKAVIPQVQVDFMDAGSRLPLKALTLLMMLPVPSPSIIKDLPFTIEDLPFTNVTSFIEAALRLYFNAMRMLALVIVVVEADGLSPYKALGMAEELIRARVLQACAIIVLADGVSLPSLGIEFSVLSGASEAASTIWKTMFPAMAFTVFYVNYYKKKSHREKVEERDLGGH